MSDKTILHTDYDSGGASNLLNYLEREGSPLRDRTGRELTDEERERFVRKSERHNHQRQIVLSPANRHDLDDRDIDRATRKVMNEYAEDRPTADYVYTIHRDTEHPHAQVAVTGQRRDLFMDREDIKETRERAHEHFMARSHDHRHERGREREQQQEHERDRQRSHGRGRGRGRGREL